MLLRPAQGADLPLLTAIAREAKAHWGYPPSALDAWRDDLTLTERDLRSACVFVAELEGGIAGFCSIAAGDAAWSLEHLWVRPGSMGQGVGRELLRRALDAARDAGATQVRIDADPHAAPFYSGLGATRTGNIAAPIEGQPQRQRPQFVISL